MTRLFLPFLTAALLTASAQAQEGHYFGKGSGGDITADLTQLDDGNYAIALTTVVPMENDLPGCAGSIEGEMTMTETGGKFFVENEDYQAGASSPLNSERFCEIKFSIDDEGFLSIEEQSGCLTYHGASCEFTGPLINSNAVN